MTIKKFYLLLFYLITLVGCNNFQTDKSDKNFQNYFVKPDWFEKPKIYVYENKSIGDSEKYIVYRYYEKINDNKLTRNTKSNTVKSKTLKKSHTHKSSTTTVDDTNLSKCLQKHSAKSRIKVLKEIHQTI